MHTQHTHVQRVCRRENAESHHCGNNGNFCLFGKSSQLVAGICGNNSATRADKGSFGIFQGFADLFYLESVSFYRRLVRPQLNAVGVLKIYHCLLNVHGHVYKHGTVPARARKVKGFLKNSGKLRCVLDKIAVLDKRLCRARCVHLLKNVAAYLVGGDLSRNADDGYAVGVSGGDSGHKVHCAGSRGGNADRGLSGDTRVAVCGVSRIGFVADKYMPYIGACKLVIKRADGSAGITKDDLDTLFFQTFYHCFGGFDQSNHSNQNYKNQGYIFECTI